jgi:DNA-binding response OmpR family regulator
MSYVLVIDDQPAIRGVVKMALEEEGAFRVNVASTGDDGLLRLDNDTPDVIVLDLVMPGMHGLELAAHACARAVPVVLMTGEPGMTATLQSLACPHLHKPFRMEQLLTEVRGALDDAPANTRIVRHALLRLLASGDASEALLLRVRTILEQAQG